MEPGLQEAALGALSRITVQPAPAAQHLADAEEYDRLRTLYEAGAHQTLAARLTLLALLGWKRTELAEGVDVSRVTVGKWIRDNTKGAATFVDYLPGLSNWSSTVLAPIVSKLSEPAARSLSGLTFGHDKLEVPGDLVDTLQALWRIAYRGRGHEITVSEQVRGASDALDVVISVLLRRGVTYFAIAKAAGVTHRAVLARMEKARRRGIILDCENDTCEGFFGERELMLGDPDVMEVSGRWLSQDELVDGDNLARLVFVRLSRPSPDNFWVQPLRVVGEEKLAVLDARLETDYVAQDDDELWARIQVALPGADEILQRALPFDEMYHVRSLGRFGSYAPSTSRWPRIEQDRSGVVAVPAPLYYSPLQTIDRKFQVPRDLWQDFIAPYSLVRRCFSEPGEVFKEWPAITR